jgi:plastocyanin
MKTSFLLIALLAAACSSSADDGTGDDPNVVKVTVGGANGNVFSPAEVTVKVGQTVRWTFEGGVHNVTAGADCAAPEPAKFQSADLSAGTFEHKFDAPGDSPYLCTFHCTMGMKGVVHVSQ